MSDSIYTLTRSQCGKLGSIAALEKQKANFQKRISEYDKNPSICGYCKNPLEYSKRKYKYCSRSCSSSVNNVGVRRHGEAKKVSTKITMKEKIENGIGPSRSVKKYLLEKTGIICNKCENTTWNGLPITIELEHIDGNSDNNSLDNVELLCPNCHSQTPTYKAKNKGNGRHDRKMRYRNGKSF
jgi:Zn finger protein HypA/HybF involved in hydrogenase expression